MNSENLKSGYAAIVGRPNVGKSTLMNRIIGEKIAITSSKPQTTRNRIQTVYTDERGQIIFLDTPGINKAKNKLGEYMLGTALSTLTDADVILWIVEASTFIGSNEQFIINELKKLSVPIILVMNKVDKIDKEELPADICAYKDVLDFAEIVPISAKKDDNIDILIEQIFRHLPEGPLYYEPDTLTDQSVKQIVSEIIREKALLNLSDEVPHGIAVLVDQYKEREGAQIVDIEAEIICEKESHKGIIIGKGGSMLKKIGAASRFEIEHLIDCRVNLKLWVKVRRQWRDSDTQLRSFGYDPRRNN